MAALGLADLCFIWVSLSPFIISSILKYFQSMPPNNQTCKFKQYTNNTEFLKPSIDLVVSCPWASYLSLTLRSISNWGSASMGICQILNSKSINIRRTCGIKRSALKKYISLMSVCTLLNGTILITDRRLNRGNFYVACWRLKTLGVLPFVQDVYYFVIVTALPFSLAFVKNCVLIRHQKTISHKINNQIVNVFMVQCVRFLIFSAPTLLDFVLRAIFPMRYISAGKMVT